jgi:hypothetical protein
VDLSARGCLDLGGESAAIVLVVGDAPPVHPVLEGLVGVVQQELRDIEADAARAHHRDALSDGDLFADDLLVVDDLRVVDAGERGDARLDAGGDHHVVEGCAVRRPWPGIPAEKVGDLGAPAEVQLDAAELEPAGVVAERLAELLLARDVHSEPELAADL